MWTAIATSCTKFSTAWTRLFQLHPSVSGGQIFGARGRRNKLRGALSAPFSTIFQGAYFWLWGQAEP
jgi:hypothetical protein